MDAASTRGREWSDSNEHRWHPFSREPVSESGTSIPNDVFTDAFVVSRSGEPVRLGLVDFASGAFEAESGGEAIAGDMGSVSDGVFQLVSGGVVVGHVSTGSGFNGAAASGLRYRMSGDVEFDASCVCSIPVSEVTSVRFGLDGPVANGPVVELSGRYGEIWPELRTRDDGDFDLVFNAVNLNVEDDDAEGGRRGRPTALKQLGITAYGKTPIVVGLHDGAWAGETGSSEFALPDRVDLYTPELSTETVCYEAHRDSDMSEIYDTCSFDGKCAPPKPKHRNIGYVIRGCSVWLNTPPDILGLDGKNGVLVTPARGSSSPSAPRLSGVSGKEAAEEVKRLMAGPIESGNGIVISIPGSSHV